MNNATSEGIATMAANVSQDPRPARLKPLKNSKNNWPASMTGKN